MANFKSAEELQNKIYQKMSVKEKLKITGQLFLLGKKLNQTNYKNTKSKENDPGKTSI